MLTAGREVWLVLLWTYLGKTLKKTPNPEPTLSTLKTLTHTPPPHSVTTGVCRGITVSWHDNLLFKCAAASFPLYLRAPSTAHTLWLSAIFSLSVSHPLTPLMPSSAPTLSRWSVLVWKPYYGLPPELQTQLDKEPWTGSEPVLRGAQTDPHVCDQQWINHEGGSISVTVPRCWDFPPFQAGGNGGNGAIWPRWQKEARSQLHISQVFNWHLIHSALLPATS